MLRTGETLFTSDTSNQYTDSGGSVGPWKDKSRNSVHAVQTTTSAKPTLSSTGINSKPALTFDGGDYMVSPAIAAMRSGEIWTVSSVTSTNRCIVENYNGGSNCFVVSHQQGNWRLAAGSIVNYLDIPVAAPTTGLTRLYWDADAAASPYYVGEYAGTTVNGNGTISDTGQTNINIGSRGTSSLFMLGSIGEIFIVNRLLTSDERLLLKKYIAGKWDVQT